MIHFTPLNTKLRSFKAAHPFLGQNFERESITGSRERDEKKQEDCEDGGGGERCVCDHSHIITSSAFKNHKYGMYGSIL